MEAPEFKFALREDLKNQDGFIPQRSDSYATGWDVRCAERDGVTFKPFEHKLINLGFRVFAPDGWWLELRPRSSTHAKKHLSCLYGVIDENYAGFAFLSCQWSPPIVNDWGIVPKINTMELHIGFGERIGQLVPVRRQVMIASLISNDEFEQLCKERGDKRGAGGFGSTG
jgi:dUTPase